MIFPHPLQGQNLHFDLFYTVLYLFFLNPIFLFSFSFLLPYQFEDLLEGTVIGPLLPFYKDLDDIGKNLIQVLKANFELRKPTDSTDPKCSYSFPVRISTFDTTSNGKPLQGRIIHMKLLIHTS